MKLILVTLLSLTLAGCSYTREIGVVGSKRFTKVQLGSLTAPGQTLMVVEDTCTKEITLLTPMGGNGVVPALLQAGGIAGGALALGNALDDNNYGTTVNNQIQDAPPAPPVYPNPPERPSRPPGNRPPVRPHRH